MKITRKEIIKKGVSASIIVSVPPVIKQVVDKCRYDINDQLFPILDKLLTPKPGIFKHRKSLPFITGIYFIN